MGVMVLLLELPLHKEDQDIEDKIKKKKRDIFP